MGTTFNIEEDLVQTEDYLAFKGNFGDIQKPAILKPHSTLKKFDKHYQRALPKKRYLVRETAEMYEKIQLPYIQSIPTADIQWVYDILDGKRETKAVVATDEDEVLGFVTVPDSKWKSHPKVDKVPREEWKLNEQVPQSLYVLSL